MRPRQALIFTIFLAAVVSAQAAHAQAPNTGTAAARIIFIGIDRARYVLVEADFALDNHPLATLNESADPEGTALFNRELPAGDHLFAAEISYRRAGGGLFSDGAGPLLHVAGSLQFHAEAGQQLTVTSRIQPRVDISGKSEWLSLSTVIDTKDSSSGPPAVSASPTSNTPQAPRVITITVPSETPTNPPGTNGAAAAQAKPPATSPVSQPVVTSAAPSETETASPAVKKTPVSASKKPSAGGAMARLQAKLRAAALKPKPSVKPTAKHASKPTAKRDGVSDRLKALLRKAAAKSD